MVSFTGSSFFADVNNGMWRGMVAIQRNVYMPRKRAYNHNVWKWVVGGVGHAKKGFQAWFRAGCSKAFLYCFQRAARIQGVADTVL